MKLRKYTLESLKKAISESRSKRQVLMKLGVVPAGGNYHTLNKAIEHFQLDTSHFDGQGWNKNNWSKTLIYTPLRKLDDLLKEGVRYSSHRLRIRLIKSGLKEPMCEKCGITEWNGEPAPLELDHVNGCHTDNRIENLRILCPNCHAQTSTYRGKNKKNKQ
jgi:hypothetical protein